ncbi:hypothetical protein QN382_08365 [Pseudomonas sp. 10B1]|uniref:hypothetical protein n=1 Tax=unclassified Pseudomonas TaxID=196821 RepID=UPI002AB38CDA|nr:MULTISPECIES: hypothetical protein [unclassified Pseudomonas]MDY7559868.1 hypothetical protein [Pseudomonas sp. AB6]MEA9977843.1 hypothetical protein [Pseudomonas sp. RTS4]MEA9992888.1 hypothetical protein [Pseudomonas sp. AA4]MEB0088286.1 hypothetical protein [Pseudomonas sp. RTI1]MEB0125734.1 hypothetical protein [Pseudomonas sp. CCC1.2]
MIRQIPKVALLIGALAIATQASAHGGGGWGPGLAVGAVVGAVVGSVVASQPRTVYVQPQPVYAPQPVYYEAPPPRVYYQPVVIERGPGYYRPEYYSPPRGYYGHPHGYYGRGYDRD